MTIRFVLHNVIVSVLLAILLVSTLPVSYGQVMQSGSYQIQSDSVNFGGGRSTSGSFTQESTFGEVATGIGTSTNYNLFAGYQQMQTVFLSLTGAADVTLSPSIGGVTGGTANGSTTVTVITDSPGGYQLLIQASTSPAMQSNGNTIANYAAGATPDFSFAFAGTESVFGFTPEGSDIAVRYQDNGVSCASSGGDVALACWEGVSTTAQVIARAGDANHPAGATTSVRFRVGVGDSVNQAPGVYVATTTVTAITL